MEHKEQINKDRRSNLKRWRRRAIEALGGKCVRCGFSDWRAIQIDHIDGDNKADRPKMGTIQYYKQVISQANAGIYQALCANCNWIKREEDVHM